MRLAISSVLVAVAVVSLAGCPRGQPPEVPLEQSDAGELPAEYPAPGVGVQGHAEGSWQAKASPCGRACANLAAVGCPEGRTTDAGVSCYRACETQALHQRLPTTCWATKKTSAEVRACGAIACPAP